MTKSSQLHRIGLTTMKPFTLRVSRGRFLIQAFVQPLGQDLLVSVWGGSRPHLGAVGMASPRPSLRNPKQWSATSSNLTFIGHKEDTVVKMVSEELAKHLRANVVVTAGIHWENLTPREIKTIQRLTKELPQHIIRKLRRRDCAPGKHPPDCISRRP